MIKFSRPSNIRFQTTLRACKWHNWHKVDSTNISRKNDLALQKEQALKFVSTKDELTDWFTTCSGKTTMKTKPVITSDNLTWYRALHFGPPVAANQRELALLVALHPCPLRHTPFHHSFFCFCLWVFKDINSKMISFYYISSWPPKEGHSVHLSPNCTKCIGRLQLSLKPSP